MSERRSLVIAILAAFVFGMAGGVIGTLATVAVSRQGGPPFFAADRHPGERPARGPRAGRPGERARSPMERVMFRQLDLSDEQRSRIRAILDEARPRYAAVRESTRARIDQVLTPGQRTKLKELEDRFSARRRQRAEP